MKKVIYLAIIVSLFLTTGCLKIFKLYDMDDIDIITTIYPVEYVANRIYGESSNISSIYPRGTDINKYELTKKQIKDYSNYDLFIYNGEMKEVTQLAC